jgi:hypothetical protein
LIACERTRDALIKKIDTEIKPIYKSPPYLKTLQFYKEQVQDVNIKEQRKEHDLGLTGTDHYDIQA